MTQHFNRGLLAAVAGAVAVLATACGGGGGGAPVAAGPTAQQQEDRAASASVAGLVAFARGQIAASTNDAATPRPVDGITPPQDDTIDPVGL